MMLGWRWHQSGTTLALFFHSFSDGISIGFSLFFHGFSEVVPMFFPEVTLARNTILVKCMFSITENLYPRPTYT